MVYSKGKYSLDSRQIRSESAAVTRNSLAIEESRAIE
jgi:hypothetical protein